MNAGAHATTMGSAHRRIYALVLTLALLAGTPAACAGWTAAPEARMACCAGDAACPMHDASAPDHGGRQVGSHGPLAQQAADACCAASAPSRQGPAASAAAAAPPPLPAGAFRVMPVEAPHLWRTAPAPALPPLLRRHLLLSVFLL